MQYAVARANVVGRTTENIGSALIGAAGKISDIAKQKGIEKKVKSAYIDILNKFAEEAVSIDPSTSKERAMITARKVYPMPIDGVPADVNLKNLLAGDVAAQKQLEILRKNAETNKAKEQVQLGAEGARTAAMGRQTPVSGFTEDVGPVMNQEQPAQYREQAMGRYGEMQANKEVPVQTTKQLEDQPSFAALPKTPVEDKDRWYKEAQLKLKNMELNRKAIDSKKGDDKEQNKNIRWVIDSQADLESQSLNNKKFETALKKALVEYKNKGNVSVDLSMQLDNMGYDRSSKSSEDLNGVLERVIALDTALNAQKAKAKLTEKGLRKNKPLSEAVPSEADVQQEVLTPAIGYIQTRIAPTLSVNGTVNQILERLPEEYKNVVSQAVEKAKAKKYSDFQIKEMLTRGRIK